MRRKCACVVTALALSGCAGSAPNPVMSERPGDGKRGCASLRAEIASNEAQMIQIARDKEVTEHKNVLLGYAGGILIVPWLFLDVKGKESTELTALRNRNQNLRRLAAEKGDCPVPEPRVKFEEEDEEEKKSEEKDPS